MDIRLLALDVDGTLAARGDEVTPRTRDALHRAAGAGLAIVLATGRRHRTTRRVIGSLGLPVPAVCLGGALVKDGGGRTLKAEVFAAHELETVVHLLRRHGQPGIAQRDGTSLGGPDFVVDSALPWNRWLSKYVERNREHTDASDTLDQAPDDVLVVGTYGERETLGAIERDLARLHDGRFASSVVPAALIGEGGWYCEIVPARVSKWQGILYLADTLRVAAEEICAAGDQVNDLPMLSGAGLAVAMGNAPDVVKDHADRVVGRHDEDGLVELVEELID